MTGIETVIPTFSSSEISRFLQVVDEYARAAGNGRRSYRQILVSYISFSPDSSELINRLLEHCIAMKRIDRFDLAIDVLSQLGEKIVIYAWDFFQHDMAQWTKLYPEQIYRPNDDYWYVMLRSVGRCKKQPDLAFSIVSACQDADSRVIIEAIVEALGDLRTSESKNLLRSIKSTTKDQFIRELAEETLSEFA